MGTKKRKLPQLGTNPPFLPRKNSKHRYTASVAFSSKYKSILVNENIQRNSYESFLSKCLHLRDRLFFISPLLKFYYEHHLQVKHTKSEHTVDNIGRVRIEQNFVSLLRINTSFVHVCLDLYQERVCDAYQCLLFLRGTNGGFVLNRG